MFMSRCGQTAVAARSAGITYAKVANYCAIAVSGNGGGATIFPVVTDVDSWKQTTPDEAFFVVLGDVYAWAASRLDDAKLLKVEDESAAGEIRREFGEQQSKLQALIAHAGGLPGLRTLWAAAGLNVAALNGLALS